MRYVTDHRRSRLAETMAVAAAARVPSTAPATRAPGLPVNRRLNEELGNQ